MDELINQITERTGIPHDAAKQAADVVIGFLKQKLPGPIGSQIDTALGMQVQGDGPNQAQEASGGLGHILGSMFGKKDEQIQH
jgi:hypothetical protein